METTFTIIGTLILGFDDNTHEFYQTFSKYDKPRTIASTSYTIETRVADLSDGTIKQYTALVNYKLFGLFKKTRKEKRQKRVVKKYEVETVIFGGDDVIYVTNLNKIS